MHSYQCASQVILHASYFILKLPNFRSNWQTWDLRLSDELLKPVQLATWSPSTTKPLIAMVLGDGIYISKAPLWRVELVEERKRVRLGMADDLYRERVWIREEGIWFSPRGEKIAYSNIPLGERMPRVRIEQYLGR